MACRPDLGFVDGFARLTVRRPAGTAAMARPGAFTLRRVHDVSPSRRWPAPDAIDAAYRTKYAGSPYLPPMVSDRSSAAGAWIRPAAH